RIEEETESEENESLEKYICENDDNDEEDDLEEDDPEEDYLERDQEPHVFNMNDSEEEGREEEYEFLFMWCKGIQDEEGTHDMGRSEE
ncbi:hypothetical protein KI387_007432, partial [Taxus chinensis]